MPSPINLLNQTFGHLTVLGPAPPSTRRTHGAHWLCRCTCGQDVVRSAAQLRLTAKLGGVSSCGSRKHGPYELDGRAMSLIAWCKKYQTNYSAVLARLSHGWELREALETPIRFHREAIPGGGHTLEQRLSPWRTAKGAMMAKRKRRFRKLMVRIKEHETPSDINNPEEQLELADLRVLLAEYLGKFSERHQTVIRRRFYEDCTLEEVGAEMGVTRERIRQLEARVLDGLWQCRELRDFFPGVDESDGTPTRSYPHKRTKRAKQKPYVSPGEVMKVRRTIGRCRRKLAIAKDAGAAAVVAKALADELEAAVSKYRGIRDTLQAKERAP